MKHEFGARSPDFEWMMGRSIEEIRAINEEALETGRSSTDVARGDSWKKRVKKTDAL